MTTQSVSQKMAPAGTDSGSESLAAAAVHSAVFRVRTHQTRPSPPVAIYAEPTLRWLSRPRQIAAIVCLVLALVALVFELTFEFWVLIAASLAIWAFDLWEKRRLGR